MDQIGIVLSRPGIGLIALRGGNSNNGAQCPGALNLNNDPANANWNIGARAAQALSSMLHGDSVQRVYAPEQVCAPAARLNVGKNIARPCG